MIIHIVLLNHGWAFEVFEVNMLHVSIDAEGKLSAISIWDIAWRALFLFSFPFILV
jgi:hypothetical protein